MVSIQEEAREAAKEAHLRYVTDKRPGIKRRRAARGWHYTNPDGEPVTNK